MDDMTKDMIPRNAVEYCLRKETVSTNPEAYKAHKKFIGYMDDPEISQFGHWMHANGYNCALVSVAVDLEKIPSVQPSATDTNVATTDTISREAAIKAADSIIERDTSGNNDVVKAMTAWKEYIKALPSAQPGWIPCSESPMKNNSYLVWMPFAPEGHHITVAEWCGSYWNIKTPITAWMPLPKAWEGGQDERSD